MSRHRGIPPGIPTTCIAFDGNPREIGGICLATIKDIAKAARVSVSTVSNVLNGKRNVGAQTRDRILKICEEMHYHPNVHARKLKTRSTNTVLFVFSDFQRSFYLRIINGINDYLLAQNISMIICTHTSMDTFLHNGSADGAIVLDQNVRDKQVLAAAGEHMPIVMMDRVLASPYIGSVITDNLASMTELTEHMVVNGYKRFHYVGGVAHTPDHMERYEAFGEVLRRNGIAFGPGQYYQGDYSQESGSRAAGLMIAAGNLPDVVVCANDSMAIGALKTFQEAGIQVPGQVAVCGFDGDPSAEVPRGFLTTMTIPRYETGYLAAEAIVSMIRHEQKASVRKIRALWTPGISA